MEVIQLVVSSVIFPYAASFTVEFYVSIFFVVDEFYKFNVLSVYTVSDGQKISRS